MRRYVTDAGPLLPKLHKLVRADCTTRNKRRAARLQANYDDLEHRIAELAQKEDLARVRPDLDGNEIMEILGIPAGPQVGQAWQYLKELRLDRGPLPRDEAVEELLKWWNAKGAAQGASDRVCTATRRRIRCKGGRPQLRVGSDRCGTHPLGPCVRSGMDYCLGDGDGSATIWSACARCGCGRRRVVRRGRARLRR